MTESQPKSVVETVFWFNRPRELSLSQKALQAMGLSRPEVIPPSTYIPVSEIGGIADEELRTVLFYQMDSSIEDRATTLVPVVFYPDRALSHVWEVLRRTRASPRKE